MTAYRQTRRIFAPALFSVVTLFSVCLGSFSANIDTLSPVRTGDVLKVADRWIAQNAVFRRATQALPAGEECRVREIIPVRISSDTPILAYHVALLPRGYLVVSADRRLTPVRCFSASSDLVLDNVPGNALRAMLMNDISAGRDVLNVADRNPGLQAMDGENPVFAENIERWDLFLSGTSSSYSLTDVGPSNIVVGPLIDTRWSQWRHFNAQCPDDPYPGFGYEAKAPAGCVPVAGAQLTRFYSWPPYGQAGHVDTDSNAANLISGVFTSDFREAFHWTNMLDIYDPFRDEPSNAVAAVSDLIYKLGVAVDIDFGSYTSMGSVAFLDLLGGALNRHFHYQEGMSIERSGNEAAFDTALRDEMIGARPVVASIPGHAVMVDGYADDVGTEYFHVNYGWGGQNDGWYHLSDINGSSLQHAVVGLVPRPAPLLNRLPGGTNVSGRIDLSWNYPEYQKAQLTGYRLHEGCLYATNLADNADTLTAWSGDIPPWTVVAAGNPGNCFRKTGQQGRYRLDLQDFIKPSGSAVLVFDYKASLIDDHFYLKTSIDGGETWTTQKHFTNTGWDTAWHHASVDLSAYAGQETLVRFEYVLDSGTYWPTGGVWIDNIRIDGVDVVVWTLVEDDIPPTTTGTTAAGRLDGCYYYSLEAVNGVEPAAMSPSYEKVTVVLAPELDVDGDGIVNGWESDYYGSPTGAVAQADSDNDGFSNLGEYLAGTNPFDDQSYFTVQAVTPDLAGVAVSWPSVSNRIYTLWICTNLLGDTGYSTVTSGIPATPPVNRFVDENAAGRSRGFYRVEVNAAP